MAGQIASSAKQMRVATAGGKVLHSAWCVKNVARQFANILASLEEMDSQEEESI